jgi:hypothetical protein
VNMISKKIEPAPFGGELQVAVEALAKVLAPVDLAQGDVDIAREDRRAADSERDQAQENCAALCRRSAATEVRRTSGSSGSAPRA